MGLGSVAPVTVLLVVIVVLVAALVVVLRSRQRPLEQLRSPGRPEAAPTPLEGIGVQAPGADGVRA